MDVALGLLDAQRGGHEAHQRPQRGVGLGLQGIARVAAQQVADRPVEPRVEARDAGPQGPDPGVEAPGGRHLGVQVQRQVAADAHLAVVGVGARQVHACGQVRQGILGEAPVRLEVQAQARVGADVAGDGYEAV